jgi:hypothetical protein
VETAWICWTYFRRALGKEYIYCLRKFYKFLILLKTMKELKKVDKIAKFVVDFLIIFYSFYFAQFSDLFLIISIIVWIIYSYKIIRFFVDKFWYNYYKRNKKRK